MNHRRRLAEATLLVASTAIAVLLAECLTRLAAPQFVYPDRRLFLSSPHFHVDSLGAVRYLPNERVRMVAIYSGALEFDVSYETNNAGFIDHQDYRPMVDAPHVHGKRYAMVGDSFAAGVHGGDPWIPRLRDEAQAKDPTTMLYNLGIEGAGPAQFHRLLVSVADEITFDSIVILAISDDFRRPMWRPLVTDASLRFCAVGGTDETCSAEPPIARIVSYGATVPDLLRMSRQGDDAQSVLRTPRLYLKNSLRHSHFLVLLWRATKRLTGLQPPPDYQSLRAIREEFGGIPVHLVHLPQKNEVRVGRYELDLQDGTTRLGINYFPALTRCDWSLEMFHERDGHPNAHGYEAVSGCVANYLGLK